MKGKRKDHGGQRVNAHPSLARARRQALFYMRRSDRKLLLNSVRSWTHRTGLAVGAIVFFFTLMASIMSSDLIGYKSWFSKDLFILEAFLLSMFMGLVAYGLVRMFDWIVSGFLE